MSSEEIFSANKDLQRQVQSLSSRNAKLAQLLKQSRDQLKDLNAQIDALGEPASTYGIYLSGSHRGREAEVFTSGRQMRLKVSPNLEPGTLEPGALVRLGDGSVVVEACGFSDTGTLATLIEKVGTERAIVADQLGNESLVHLTNAMRTSARAGDTVLIDAKAGFAVERVDKTEVAQLSLEQIPDITYDDIGGLGPQIETIKDSVELPFSHPDLYKTYDLQPPKGLLLYGPPGCGKTLIAKAVANSLSSRIGDGGKAYFLNVKGPELLNKFVGETERRIRLIFERARELAGDGRPVIIFFDEMESIFRTRGSGVSSDMETTVVPQLLTEIDGVEGISNVIVIGATNREELIDPAILRPGRLDIKVRIDRPGQEESADIFSRHLTDSIPHEGSIEELIEAGVTALFNKRPYVQLQFIDGSTEVLDYSAFVSGAMIANIVDRAKKLAIKDHIAGVSTGGLSPEHLRDAVIAEQNESEDLPNTASPEEWSRIVGRHGKRVVSVEVVG